MIKNIPGLIEKVKNELISCTDKAVVGLSGGADSTTIAILSTLALGKENVYGIHMPYSERDNSFFNARSWKLADRLGIRGWEIPVAPIANAINSQVSKAVGIKNLTTVNEGNARSRARMCVLYSVAHHLNTSPLVRARVIGTGNLSEDFIGYDTKGGDALCDIFPIGTLFKSEVYQLLEYFRDQGLITEEMIDRVPSAGLWDGQSDEEELGHSYNSMEPIIKELMKPGRIEDRSWTEVSDIQVNKLETFILNRHFQNKHKHEAPPVISLREFCD